MISTTALVFAINIITSALKKWIYPNFGATGVQVFVFIAATIGAFYSIYGGNYPGLKDLVMSAVGVFSLAVAFYEVILSKIPVFEQPSIDR